MTKERATNNNNNKSLFKPLNYANTYYNGTNGPEKREMRLSRKAIHVMFHYWESNHGPHAMQFSVLSVATQPCGLKDKKVSNKDSKTKNL